MNIYLYDIENVILPFIPKKLGTGIWVWLFWIFRFTSKPVPAFWFSTPEQKLRYGDVRFAEVGTTHACSTNPELCYYGLHASLHVADAMHYAPGNICWKVLLDGKMDFGYDKFAATSRTYLKKIDANGVMRTFACTLLLNQIPDKIRVGHTSINTRTLKKHLRNPHPNTLQTATRTLDRLRFETYHYSHHTQLTRLLGDSEYSEERLQKAVDHLLMYGVVGHKAKECRKLFADMIEAEFKKAVEG